MFSSVLYNQSKLGNLPTTPTMMSFPRNKMKSVTLSRTTTLSWVKTSVKHSSNSASQHQLTKPMSILLPAPCLLKYFFNYWPMFKCIALLCCYQRHVSLFASVSQHEHCTVNLNVKILHSVSVPSTLHFEDITHLITFLMRRRKASRADRQKFLPYMATCTEKKNHLFSKDCI